MRNQPNPESGPLIFDDTIHDEGRCIDLIGAAALAKVSDLFLMVAAGDQNGAMSAARMAAQWLNDFGFANVDPDVLYAEAVDEVEAARNGSHWKGILRLAARLHDGKFV